MKSYLPALCVLFALPCVAKDCANLEQRVSLLESKAVTGDTKKIIISGQVNRAVIWTEDGLNSNIAHVDNDNVVSRVTFEGEADYNEDLSFKARAQIRMIPNSSALNRPGKAQSSSEAADMVSVRLIELFVKSKAWGTLSIGHGYTATGTLFFGYLGGLSNFLSSASFMGTTPFRNKISAMPDATVIPFDVYSVADGPGNGRRDRLKYDAPAYKGFKFSVAHAYELNGDIWDAGLRYRFAYKDYMFAANVGAVRNQSRNSRYLDLNNVPQRYTYDSAAYSLGVFMPYNFSGKPGAGLALTLGQAKRFYPDLNYRTGTVLRLSASYRESLISDGLTSFEVSFSKNENLALAPTPDQLVKGRALVVGLDQNLKDIGVEVYLAYTNQKLKIKNSGQRYHDHNAVMLGSRVKL